LIVVIESVDGDVRLIAASPGDGSRAAVLSLIRFTVVLIRVAAEIGYASLQAQNTDWVAAFRG
jgi:hypothetical protein